MRSHSSGALRRLRDAVQWAVPGAILVVMPKCPLCVAAYITLLTGVGVSLSAAAHLRMLTLAICVATIAFLVARSAARKRRAVGGV